MNEENNGTRSFQATEQEKPQKKFDIKRIVSISIFAVAIVIVLLFIAAIIAQIACKVSDGKAPSDNQTVPLVEEIEYENKELKTSEIKKGELQLATKDHPASLSEEEIKALESLYSTPTRKSGSVEYYTIAGGEQLTLKTAEQFGALTKALYEETGCDQITVKYAYFEPKSNTANCDFPHALGTTVDICLKLSKSEYSPLSSKPEILNWINQNCARFGFVNSDISGEIHDEGTTVPTTQLRYVGIPHATYIMQNEITFEEYIDRVKNYYYTTSNTLNITGADGKQYAVYYAVVDGSHPVSVPKNRTYTYSGNNDGGIIVTINK